MSESSYQYFYKLLPDFSVFSIAEQNYYNGGESGNGIWYNFHDVTSTTQSFSSDAYRVLISSDYQLDFTQPTTAEEIVVFSMNYLGKYVYAVFSDEAEYFHKTISYTIHTGQTLSTEYSTIEEVYF